jgi:hypothetical protein
MFPQKQFTLKEFLKLIKISFWVLLSNFFLLDTLNRELDCVDSCNNEAAVVISYLILMIFAILLPVLFINLLIIVLLLLLFINLFIIVSNFVVAVMLCRFVSVKLYIYIVDCCCRFVVQGAKHSISRAGGSQPLWL